LQASVSCGVASKGKGKSKNKDFNLKGNKRGMILKKMMWKSNGTTD